MTTLRRVTTQGSYCLLLILLWAGCTKPPQQSAASSAQPLAVGALPKEVVLSTSLGEIVLQLQPEQAPQTCANFIQYVQAGFYDGTVFRRVIDNFMIQGGGYDKDLQLKPTRAPIVNEAKPERSNVRGTVAMARTQLPDSATAQFFINVTDNKQLDATGPGTGYAVFAQVKSGMDVVDKIRNVPTRCPSWQPGPCEGQGLPPGMRDVPTQPVIINKALAR